MQDYSESLIKRLDSGTDKIDLFVTGNIVADSDRREYAVDYIEQKDKVDLSGTYEGLIQNFTVNEDNSSHLYAVPFGAEVRGMYVNTTLLDSLNIQVPTNREEFLKACKEIKDAGYVPIQGNPGAAPQQLLYPYICNGIANADNYKELYNKINNKEEDVSELFEDEMTLAYTLMENDYYKYKYIENEYNMYTSITNEEYARSFLNLAVDEDGNYTKIDDIGIAAFLPATISLETAIEDVKEAYHSNIEYKFILAPVGEDGGYAYMSPSDGIAVNNNSDNTDWALSFVDFLFEKKNIEKYAKEDNIIANTTKSYDVVKKQLDVPENHICQLGEVTFDYSFYGIINDSLTEVMKGNNPKYMETDSEGNTALYSLDYYMKNMSDRFKESD